LPTSAIRIQAILQKRSRPYAPECVVGAFRELRSEGRAEKRVPAYSFVEPGGLLRDNELRQPAPGTGRIMGRRRRGFDEFDEETREPAPSGSGGGWIVAATFIKYAAIIVVVLIVAYVVLRILGVLQTSV
jgi:hypothetical protein